MAAEALTGIRDLDLTAELIGLLNSDACVVEAGVTRALEARDVAILVSTNQRGRQVAEALTGAGVPVAFSGADSIFVTDAAKGWLVLLRALEQPRRAAVRGAILTDFVGDDLTGLALADEEQLTAWSGLLQGWSRVLASQGVAALFAAVPQAEVIGVDGAKHLFVGHTERVLDEVVRRVAPGSFPLPTTFRETA